MPIERHAEIAVITIDNPPMNTLSQPARAALFEGLKESLADGTVRGVVVRGARGTFCAGAEVREFNTPAAVADPDLNDITAALDAADKPVLALIEGVALGGGFEVALGCHYRLATPDARVGLPEVTLGLLPGGGGTQRLPRLIGIEPAIKVMTEGALIPAPEALRIGMIEGVTEGDPLGSAIAHLRALPADSKPVPISARTAPFKSPGAGLDNFEDLIAGVRARAKGAAAPVKIAECVRAAATMPFDQGIVFERKGFLTLAETPESRALRHLFFAERAARRVAGVDKSVPVRPIGRAGVVGSGTMGTGIALALASAGIDVIVVDADTAALQRSEQATATALSSMVRRGRMTQALADKAAGRLSCGDSIGRLGNVDLVIEAVTENLKVKQAVFAELDRVVPAGAILATNTSFLDVDVIAGATARPDDVVGMHFFSPAHIMRLLEIVRGAKTSATTLATVLQLARRLDKVGVVARVCDGFIGNRMIDRYLMRAYELVAAGCSPREVDSALESFGMAMGPFAMQDLSGNDIGWMVRKRKREEDPTYRYPDYMDRLCEQGWFGQKAGRGWYRYEDGSRKPLPHEQADDLIAQWRADHQVPQRSFTAEQIVERCIFSLIDEGARVLEEGVAERAGDIDLVYTTGFGFPALRGGPMFYGEERGLDSVVMTLSRLAQEEPDHGWAVSPYLEAAASAGSFDAVTKSNRSVVDA